MKKLTICSTIIFSFILFVSASKSRSQSAVVNSRIFGFHVGTQLTFDIYKPFASVYVNLKRLQKPVAIEPGQEKGIYWRLGQRLFAPQYILFQATGYPLSALSSYLETDHLNWYHKFDTYYDINVLRSIGSGFEEPYAFSLLLGNILFLAYKDSSQRKLKQSGSALAGFLLSAGGHQIHNNIYFHDSWYQVELMLLGNLNEPRTRRLSWNFRIGAKFHHYSFLRDTFIFSIERSHTDWTNWNFSLLKNSLFKYRIYIPIPSSAKKMQSTSQIITFGKKFPVNRFHKKFAFILSFGLRWEWVRLYDHQLQQFESQPIRQMVWLVQPNVEF